jgi:hypothetical protein
MINTLLYLLIMLSIVGIILWGIGQIPGIPQIVKTIIVVLVCVALLVYLLQYLGGHRLGL